MLAIVICIITAIESFIIILHRTVGGYFNNRDSYTYLKHESYRIDKTGIFRTKIISNNNIEYTLLFHRIPKYKESITICYKEIKGRYFIKDILYDEYIPDITESITKVLSILAFGVTASTVIINNFNYSNNVEEIEILLAILVLGSYLVGLNFHVSTTYKVVSIISLIMIVISIITITIMNIGRI